MMLGENAQELLEQLWIALVEQQKDSLDVDGVFAEGRDELLQLEMVEKNNKALTLTEHGRLEAAQAIRRHRLGERLLTDVLKTEGALMEEQACRLEHALFDGVDDSICTLLGHPTHCPHGKPIPAGECCRQHRATVTRLIAPLNDLQPGEGGKIAYLQMNHPARLHKLMSMGVLPGGKISLLRRSPSFVFETGYSQFAVDEDIAADIYVRLRGN